MTIQILLQKETLQDRYKILIDGKIKYCLKRKVFALLKELKVLDWQSEELRIRVKQQWSFMTAKYLLSFGNSTNVLFETVSMKNAHFQCFFKNDKYEIFGHKGVTHSVYKNDRQIAWWKEESKGRQYTIIADSDCNADLIIGLCQVLYDYKLNPGKDKINATGNITDYGYVGREAKEFDAAWMPKV